MNYNKSDKIIINRLNMALVDFDQLERYPTSGQLKKMSELDQDLWAQLKEGYSHLKKADIKKVSRYLPINSIEDTSFNLIKKKPIIPTAREIEINLPSRSAKLRAVKRKGKNKVDTQFIFDKFKYLLEIENLASKL